MGMRTYQIVAGQFEKLHVNLRKWKNVETIVTLVHLILNSVKKSLCENQVIISGQKINLIVDVDGVPLYKSISA